jgi:hypothetical protein
MTAKRIAELGHAALPVVVTLREHLNVRFLEIRLYRRDERTQQLSPTDWAVGIDAATFSELKLKLDESSQHIQEWFGPREKSIPERVHTDMVEQAKAQEDASRNGHKVEIRKLAWDSPTFFSTHSEGGSVVVQLNTSHSVTGKSSANGYLMSGLLPAILAAYHDAKNRFCETAHCSAARLFAALEYEWGVILQKYADRAP